MDDVIFYLEDFEEYFRNRDLKQGADPCIYRNHTLSTSNVREYVNYKLCNENDEFREIYYAYKNFKWEDEMANADEFSTIYQQYKNFVPENKIIELAKRFRESRGKKVKPVNAKRDETVKPMNDCVEISW